jgi:PAS domain S-box-containing protein
MKRKSVAAKSARVCAVGIGALAVLAMLCPFAAAAAPPVVNIQAGAKHVLLLFSFFERDHTALDRMESSLRARLPWPVDFSVEYLESPRFEERGYRDSLAETLRREYEGRKPDLVMAASEPALRFAVEYRETVFPGVPIVFWAISSSLADQKMPGVTGVASPAGVRETVDLALGLQPDTTAVAVITNTSETEKYWLGEMHKELLRHQDKVREIDLVGPPGADMLQKVAALPSHTVVMFQQFPQDSNQPPVSNWDVLAATSAHLPTYSFFQTLSLDRGGIGGAYYDASQNSILAGELAARVLGGERPDDIPVVHVPILQVTVDWRQLQRWHISEAGLPPGSLVLFRRPDVWQLYKWYIVGGIALILLQAALIVALLWYRARRRRSERELEIAYDRLRMAVDAARYVGWDADYRTGRNRWFGDMQSMFGITDDNYAADLGQFRKCVHPDDREKMEQAMQTARERRTPYAAEFRVVRTDGTLRWISARGKFYFNSAGETSRMLGMATDITERKQAEEALAGLSGNLIRAQEEERRRIAREIHDDYQQRLAVLGIELGSLAQDIGTDDRIALARLRDLAELVNTLGMDLHSLSHRLHSSTLDSMGLVAALRGLCSEFRKYHDLKVSLVTENVPEEIPSETALCIFRITQEALQNVRKHSHARSAEVHVEGVEGTVRLSVSDQGRGFDAGHPSRDGGIGIRSMAERVRLVNGRLEVHSRPGAGTIIEAWVPVVLTGDDGEPTTSTAQVHS